MTFLVNTQRTVLASFLNERGMKPQKGDFGLEIECEGDGNFIIECKGWVTHHDNSLRGPKGVGAGGVEYITHGAVAQHDIPGMVARLRDAVMKNGTIRDDSPRTSTHIHVNVQQEKIIDVLGCLVVFAAIEPLFLHLCGPRRDGNSFCNPSFDSGDLVDWVHAMGSFFHKHSGDIYELPQRGKYASFGTNRLHDLGTIECRTFPCSLDPDQIGMWCKWLANLRDFVRRQDDKSHRGTIKLGLHDPMALVSSIFGAIPESRYLASELVEYGCQEAYELTRILKYWMKQEKPEKKALKKADPSAAEAVDAFMHAPPRQNAANFAAPQAAWSAPRPIPAAPVGLRTRRIVE